MSDIQPIVDIQADSTIPVVDVSVLAAVTNTASTEIAPKSSNKRQLSEKQLAVIARNKWKPGQSGNPSGTTPMKRKQQQLDKALAKALTTDDYNAIVMDMIAQAKAGDVFNRKLYFDLLDKQHDYHCGKASQPVELNVLTPADVQKKLDELLGL